MKPSVRLFIEKTAIYILLLSKIGMIFSYFYTGNSIWLVSLSMLVLISLPIYYVIYEGIVGEEKVTLIKSKICKLIHLFIAFILIVLILCILIFQVYGYLKNGIWVPLSVTDALIYLEFKWASNPTDWTGLWTLINKVPLSACLLLIDLYVFYDYDKTYKQS